MQSHGSHWECIDSDVEGFLKKHIDDFLKKSNCVDFSDFNGYNIQTQKIQDNEVIVLLNPIEEQAVKSITILVNKSIFTSFPVADMGIEHKVKLEKISKWDNEIEANLKLSIANKLNINLFDTMYYKNQSKYEESKEYEFILNGFMYYCTQFDYEKFNLESNSSEMTLDKDSILFFPMDGGASDDYRLITPIVEVEIYDDIFGKKFYKLIVSIYSDKETNIEATLMVNSENLLNGYIPKIGDSITSAIWLTGMLKPENIEEEDNE